MASRRKRGPVAFRPRLLAGLALSLLSLSVVEDWSDCLLVNVIGIDPRPSNVRFLLGAVIRDKRPAIRHEVVRRYSAVPA